MSEPWTPEQRGRLAALEQERIAALRRALPPDRVDTIAKRGGAIGCLLMLALVVLGLAGLVALVWRRVFVG